MNSEHNGSYEDDEFEETEVFLVGDRKYQDFSKTVNFFQKNIINCDKTLYSEVAVIATPKFKLHQTNGFSHYVINYSSDIRPYNKVGPAFKGMKQLSPKRDILWRSSK